MLSAFCYTGIACLIFFFISGEKLKRTVLHYSAAELLIFYALMRLCPMLMLAERSIGNYIAFAADLAVLGMIVFVSGKLFGKEKTSNAAVLYQFDPLAAISIICGKDIYTALNIAGAAAALIFLAVIIRKLPKVPCRAFFKSYIFLCTSIFLFVCGAECGEEAFDRFFSLTGFPLLGALGTAAAIAAAVLTAKVFIRIKRCETICCAVPDKPAETEELSVKQEKFGRKNLFDMTALTLICGVLTFTRLGSFEAPQNGMEFSGDNKEIMLDFGSYIDITKLKIYLGANDSRKIVMFAYNEAEQKWIDMKRAAEIPYPFEWNEADVGWNLRYLDIIFTDDTACVNELVVLGADGRPVIPVNAGDYPELFGENYLYPEYSTYFYRMMFDEIYHGRTAYEFLHDLPIYEDTHPPLGKTIISLGISAFGMTPFGWRVMSALFGTLMVPVMYLFAWKISRRSDIAFLGGSLLAAEFMHFTLSRIATADIFVALFILLMFCFMYCFADSLKRGEGTKKQYVWLFLCGVSSALAAAIKWTGVYAVSGIAVLFFVSVIEKCTASQCTALGGIKKSLPYLTRLGGVCVVSFIVIPLIVYTLSYIQFSEAYPEKGIILHAIDNSKHMLSYHSNITSGHPFQSEWYEWLIDKRPVLNTLTYIGDKSISSAATFGNPIIVWGGLAALLHNFYLWRCCGCKRARFLIIAYLAMLMPWLFIHRTVFIYQYFGCILILVLLLCSSVMNLKKSKAIRSVLIVGSVLMFAVFFTELSGITVSKEYAARFLEWFPTWDFG